MITDELYIKIRADLFYRMKKTLDPQHDISHIKRVLKNSKKLIKILSLENQLNYNLVRVNALIHDLTYTIKKPGLYTYFFEGKIMEKFLPQYLNSFRVNEEDKRIIINSVMKHPHSFPFRKLNRNGDIYTKILQDADTIDFFHSKRVRILTKSYNIFKFNGFLKLIETRILKFREHKLKYFLNYPQVADFFYTKKKTKLENTLRGYKKLLSEKNVFRFIEHGSPNKPTILFLHGYADSALMFGKLAKSLAHTFHTIAIDFPMMHDNDKVQNIESLTKFVYEFVKQKDLINITLVGFSLGGVVAANFSVCHPQLVREVFLLNSSPSLLVTKTQKKLYILLRPLVYNRVFCFIYSRLNTNNLIRKLFNAPRASKKSLMRMKSHYNSVYKTVINILGVDVANEFKKLKIKKNIILFKDDTLVPWEKYKNFVEKLNCNIVVFASGWHAVKKQYWENLKTLWLKGEQKEFNSILVEK